MPIVDKYDRLLIKDIKIERDTRQRREVNTKGLLESVKANGVLVPIIVQHKNDEIVLVAGERRIMASLEADKLDIPVRWAEDLTAIESEIFELEENAKRSDLPWIDNVTAVDRIHKLHQELDPDWTMAMTAESVSLSPGIVSMYLKVAGQLNDEKVYNCGTVREAYNLLSRRDSRAAGDALTELLEATDGVVTQKDSAKTPGSTNPSPANPDHVQDHSPRPPTIVPAEQSILLESFLQWAPRYNGRKFNLLHCDFPYGINLFNGPQGGGRDENYADSKDIYFALLDCFCTNLDRIMAQSAHLMFWFSGKHRDETRRIFRERCPDLVFAPYELIWTKTDNAGIAADPTRQPRHIYETCFLAARGRRQLVKVAADWYGCQTDRTLHVSTKPESMLHFFMGMLVDENTNLLDPTCGSGAALRAAERLGANSVLGMDIDEQTVGLARGALRNARLLRKASKAA